MAKAPTTDSDDVATFLAAIDPPARRDEAQVLDALFRHATGYAPRLWPGGIVGYGRYAYRYDSGHSGVSLATGFAARKADLVIYVLPGYAELGDDLLRLGPHRLGKACLYLRRLQGIDLNVLSRIVQSGLVELSARWTIEPT
jgi:hypothetical protein